MKSISTICSSLVTLFLLTAPAMALDWPMWGGTPDRNMVSDAKPVSLDFDLEKGTDVAWTANLGSQTYGNPVVADGRVFVGTNNGGGYRKEKHPADQDRGVLLCFDEKNGDFLWQLTREKLASGRVNDWLLQGICSAPCIEGDRMWVVSNRCELMCLDTAGFHDGENDGPVKDEVDAEKQDADVVWNLDMIEELGVFPHNLATSSPVIHGDLVFIVTSNGVAEDHIEVPSPRAPCFLAVNKNTGEVAWEHNQPFDQILHGQWGSPSIGIVNGKAQVYFPGGDGWMYAHDAETGEEIWKFDCNPKETKWELQGAGTRNAIISTPVFYENSVIVSVGQDPEHGEAVGHMYRIDATKTGDISPELGEIGKPGKPNPTSGAIWHYGGMQQPATDDEDAEPWFRRTMSTVAVADGLVFNADLSGFVHCVDLKTGKRHWEHDMLSGVWGSCFAVDGKVFLGNEDGVLTVFEQSLGVLQLIGDDYYGKENAIVELANSPENFKKMEALQEALNLVLADEGREVVLKVRAEVLAEKNTVNYSSVYSTPTFANGRMYLSDRKRLYAVDVNK